MRRVFYFLTGFLAGAVAGGVVGLLFSPARGTELQEQIRGRFEALLEEGRKAAASRRSELEAQLEAFKTGESLTIEAAPE